MTLGRVSAGFGATADSSPETRGEPARSTRRQPTKRRDAGAANTAERNAERNAERARCRASIDDAPRGGARVSRETASRERTSFGIVMGRRLRNAVDPSVANSVRARSPVRSLSRPRSGVTANRRARRRSDERGWPRKRPRELFRGPGTESGTGLQRRSGRDEDNPPQLPGGPRTRLEIVRRGTKPRGSESREPPLEWSASFVGASQTLRSGLESGL